MDPHSKPLAQGVRGACAHSRGFLWVSLLVLFCFSQALAQSPQTLPETGAAAGQQLLDLRPVGSISGAVVDPSGAPVAGARVGLTHSDSSPSQRALSDDDGQFFFGNIAPGPFQLTIAVEGFADSVLSGTLHDGENYNVPRVALVLATEKTELVVEAPRLDVAEEQVKEEEKQRVFGIVPNFYVSYVPNAAPLSAKQKFELALRTTVDPVNFALTGVIAGAQQARDYPSGYGQGAQGYGKRYGATYANGALDTFIGGAIFPVILKQDPRYFYKGSGSVRSRILYAIANAVICKGDNGRWQPNYSNVLGSLAAGGISNLYYPAENRNGTGLTFENAAIEIGASAAANLLQEFVFRKLTPNIRNHNPASPQKP